MSGKESTLQMRTRHRQEIVRQLPIVRKKFSRILWQRQSKQSFTRERFRVRQRRGDKMLNNVHSPGIRKENFQIIPERIRAMRAQRGENLVANSDGGKLLKKTHETVKATG